MLRTLAVGTYALTTLFQVAITSALCVQSAAALNGSMPTKSILWLLFLVPLSVPLIAAIGRMLVTRLVLPPILFERAPIVALGEIVAFVIAASLMLRAWTSDSLLRSENILGAFALTVLLTWTMLGITELTIARLGRVRRSGHMP